MASGEDRPNPSARTQLVPAQAIKAFLAPSTFNADGILVHRFIHTYLSQTSTPGMKLYHQVSVLILCIHFNQEVLHEQEG